MSVWPSSFRIYRISAVTEIEQSILQTLEELDAAVKTLRTSGPKPNLASFFQRLDDLTGRLPKDAPPDLLHYLHRKSYEKARLFLLGRGGENARGSCGGK